MQFAHLGFTRFRELRERVEPRARQRAPGGRSEFSKESFLRLS